MLDFTFALDGLDEALAKADATGIELRGRLGAGLYREAEAVMAVSKEERVPVDEGTLKGTGHVDPPDVGTDGEVSVTLGYGGPAAPYAAEVHENPVAQANREIDRQLGVPRHGDWKYLENPLLEAVHDGMLERLRDRLVE